MLGKIAQNEIEVFNNFKNCFSIKDRKILEVGGCLDENLLKNEQIALWHSVDPLNSKNYYKDHFKYSKSTIHSCKLKSNFYDYCFSSNAFEHINDFKTGMQLIYNSMKEGGIVYAHFGPVYSGPDGHHLQGLELDGIIYNFWDGNLIPHWSHLALDKHEFYKLFSAKYNEKNARLITEAVFISNWINRLFFEEYLTAFMNTGFKIQHLETTQEVDYQYSVTGISTERLKQLAYQKLGKSRDIETRDVLVILKK